MSLFKMKRKIYIGIIGDYDAQKQSHAATVAAIDHAAARLSLDVAVTWLPTISLLDNANLQELQNFDGFWASPGAPYKSMEGALRGIMRARETGKPLIGT
jgi:CTP synthase (UTP-ammonia lyase)